MVTTVQKTLADSGANYSTIALWLADCPADLTRSRTGTTQAGSTSSTIVLDGAASASDDFYNGLAVWCDARTSEKRLITDYVGATKTATVGALNGSGATWDNTPGTEAFTIDSVIWEGQVTATGLTVTGGATISGKTVGASNFIRLTTKAGDGFEDHADAATNPLRYDSTKGAFITGTTGGRAGVIENALSYTEFVGLQVRCTAGAFDAVSGCIGGTTGTSVKVLNCILQNEIATGTLKVCAVGFTGGTPIVANSLLLVDGGGSSVYGAYVYDLVAVFRNCTIAGDATSGYGFRINLGDLALHNCVITGFSSGVRHGSGGAFTGQNNATDLGSGLPTTNANYSVTPSSEFKDVSSFANSNYQVKDTNATIYGNGYDDTTVYSDADIRGTDRNAAGRFDIGAWEYVAGGGGGGGSNGLMMLHGQFTGGM